MAEAHAPMTSIPAIRAGAGNAPPDLAAILSASTNLRDGACVGDWATFDPKGESESPEDAGRRHNRAITICATCPVLAECKAWLAGLPKRQRPSGVIAGRYIPPVDERVRKSK